jgi:hypothetical protein
MTYVVPMIFNRPSGGVKSIEAKVTSFIQVTAEAYFGIIPIHGGGVLTG